LLYLDLLFYFFEVDMTSFSRIMVDFNITLKNNKLRGVTFPDERVWKKVSAEFAGWTGKWVGE
jgi:hypothetical protein